MNIRTFLGPDYRNAPLIKPSYLLTYLKNMARVATGSTADIKDPKAITLGTNINFGYLERWPE